MSARPITYYRKLLLFFLVINIVAPYSTFAVTDHWFYKAVIAWDKQDYRQARILFSRSANLGNAEACYNLGVMYQQGMGVRSNISKAKYWLKRAARQGSSNAEFALARLIIAQRRKSNRDIQQAKRWLRSAAHKKNPRAMYWLGTLYTMGQGVKISHTKAAYWYIKAARLGHASAQLHSARLYNRGIGVKRNKVTAYAWAKLAMMQGAMRARQNWLYIKKRMSAQQRLAGDLLAQYLTEPPPKTTLGMIISYLKQQLHI